MFSKEELDQYSRQIRLDGFGESAQEKLKSAKVLVVGAGALGSPVLSYLAAAGVGNICIVDGDKVERSNLHRQILFTAEDIGQSKAACAMRRLRLMNPEIQITCREVFISAENAIELANEFQIIVDGTDNFPTRYLVNDLCVLNGKVNIHGSIQQFSGQVSVFNALLKDGERGPNYRDLYPMPPNPNEVVSCAEGGVIGALPGIIGSMMAMECIKAITGVGELLSGKLLQFDSLTGRSHLLTFTKDDENPLSGTNPKQSELIDYDQFCGLKKENKMKSINVHELKEMMDNQEDFQLIDVREQFEYDEANMKGHLIPLKEIPSRFSEIDRSKKVVVHCKMGGRSANAIGYLEQNHGFENLYNLEGGIISWITFNR